MTNFEFNPTQVAPQTAVAAATEPKQHRAQPRTDAERIANAKAQAKQSCKEHNLPGSPYGFGYDESYFRDFCGPESSWWAASHLVYAAQLIETTINGQLIPIGGRDVYSPRTGEFKSLGFSIQQLRAAYTARIVELGLSQLLIEEYLTTIHSDAEYRAFWRLSFEERISRFKQGQ